MVLTPQEVTLCCTACSESSFRLRRCILAAVASRANGLSSPPPPPLPCLYSLIFSLLICLREVQISLISHTHDKVSEVRGSHHVGYLFPNAYAAPDIEVAPGRPYSCPSPLFLRHRIFTFINFNSISSLSASLSSSFPFSFTLLCASRRNLF